MQAPPVYFVPPELEAMAANARDPMVALMKGSQSSRKARIDPPEQRILPETIFKSAYVDEEEGVVYAIAATSETVDLDDDILSSRALVQMAHDFTSSGKRTFKANHGAELKAHLVASITGTPMLKSGKTLKAGENIPANDPVVGLSLGGDQTCWIVGIKPEDKAIVELAKAGGISGLSWGAFAKREPMETGQ
jgi:hypothetical protein